MQDTLKEKNHKTHRKLNPVKVKITKPKNYYSARSRFRTQFNWGFCRGVAVAGGSAVGDKAFVGLVEMGREDMGSGDNTRLLEGNRERQSSIDALRGICRW